MAPEVRPLGPFSCRLGTDLDTLALLTDLAILLPNFSLRPSGM
jgi:hypothetical protein